MRTEIGDEMVARAKRKLASGRLSEADKSYYKSVVRDFGPEAEQSARATAPAAKPSAPAARPAARPTAPVAWPAAAERFFGLKPASASASRIQEEQRAAYFGSGGQAADPAPAQRLLESERKQFFGM